MSTAYRPGAMDPDPAYIAARRAAKAIRAATAAAQDNADRIAVFRALRPYGISIGTLTADAARHVDGITADRVRAALATIPHRATAAACPAGDYTAFASCAMSTHDRARIVDPTGTYDTAADVYFAVGPPRPRGADIIRAACHAEHRGPREGDVFRNAGVTVTVESVSASPVLPGRVSVLFATDRGIRSVCAVRDRAA